MTTHLVVYGDPAAQGSKKAVGRRKNGSTILVEQSARVAPWRALVTAQTRHQVTNAPGWVPLEGAMRVCLDFTVRAPARLPAGRTRPAVRPDLDKLTRAVLDALTAAHLWVDDSQVVSLVVEEWYPGPAPALGSPGVRISVTRASPGSLTRAKVSP